jgi:ribose-phosphate pyrophosphokinase
LVGRFLAQQFNAVITVDPHLHRIRTLAEAIPCQQAVALSAAALIGQHVAKHQPEALLLAPDEEAEQWVAAAGKAAGLQWAVCHKDRHGDRQVQVQLPEGLAWAGRSVVLIDDVCSSGHTLAEAARRLFAARATRVDVAVTHALFAPGAQDLLQQTGVGEIWSTDSIAHPTNAIGLAGLLAAALKHEKKAC